MSTPGMNEKAVRKGMELRLDSAIDGIDVAFPPNLQTLNLRGVHLTKDDLKKRFDEAVHRWKEARAAHEILRQFAKDKPELFKIGQELLADFKAALSAHFGRESEQLARFGFSPLRKPRALSVEEKALRAAKAKLTREMRGTKGARQREAIRAEETPTVEISPDGTSVVKPATPAPDIDPTNNPSNGER